VIAAPGATIGAVADSIRVVVDSAVNLVTRGKTVLAIASAIGFAVVQVAMWANGVAKTATVEALSKRVDALELARDAAARAAYEERAATVTTLRNMAGDAAARARPRDPDAARNARERFDELVLKQTAPITALDIVLRDTVKR
jgi:hypothetical protein